MSGGYIWTRAPSEDSTWGSFETCSYQVCRGMRAVGSFKVKSSMSLKQRMEDAPRLDDILP